LTIAGNRKSESTSLQQGISCEPDFLDQGASALEVPSYLALEQFGARTLDSRIMVTWGLAPRRDNHPATTM
jgi:hypothetical protein